MKKTENIKKQDNRRTFWVYIEIAPDRYDLDYIKAETREEAEKYAEDNHGYVVN